MTGQEEVTNTLMDRVADYINEPLQLHFALEQLGLTWEEFFVMDENTFSFKENYLQGFRMNPAPADYYYFNQQVRCEGNTEKNITRNDKKNILKIGERTFCSI